MKVRLDSIHSFRKTNTVTQEDGLGQYDEFKCSDCGLAGKVRDLINVEIDGRKANKAKYCNKKNQLVKKQHNSEFQEAKPTDISCPKCVEKVRKLHEWYEENDFTNVTAITAICSCGFKDLLTIT